MSEPQVHLTVKAFDGIASLQDEGRYGHETSGVPNSGAWHRHRFHEANFLAANSSNTPAIELLAGTISLTNPTCASVCVAVTGVAHVYISDRSNRQSVPTDHSTPLHQDACITIQHSGPGPVYIAIHGLEPPTILGSASECSLSGIKPLALGASTQILCRASDAPPRFIRGGRMGHPRTFAFLPHVPLDNPVAAHVSRIGRTGIHLGVAGALPPAKMRRSHPAQPGVIQVTPSGLIVLGPDSGVTGGYPTLGAVHSTNADALADLTPNDTVVLVPAGSAHGPQTSPITYQI